MTRRVSAGSDYSSSHEYAKQDHQERPCEEAVASETAEKGDVDYDWAFRV